MNRQLIKTYKEVRNNMPGYIVGQAASNALFLAKAILQAEELGLTVTWDTDECFSIGDQGDWISDDAFDKGLTEGRYEVLVGRVEGHDGTILAALGGVIVDYRGDWQSYLESHEYELLAEALQELKTGN